MNENNISATDIMRQNLIAAREKAGFSQRDLAERMGVQQSNISRIETKAIARITVNLIDKWMKACGFEYEFVLKEPAVD